MKKNLISLIAVGFFGLSFLSPAHAISHAFRAQLERSGCTEMNAGQGCDIHKTKAQNMKHLPLSAVTSEAESVIGTDIAEGADFLLSQGWRPNNGDWFKAGHQLRLVVEDEKVVNAQLLK